MASKDAIKEAILKSSGNPEYGIVVDNEPLHATYLYLFSIVNRSSRQTSQNK
jgi:hypothetical protein